MASKDTALTCAYCGSAFTPARRFSKRRGAPRYCPGKGCYAAGRKIKKACAREDCDQIVTMSRNDYCSRKCVGLVRQTYRVCQNPKCGKVFPRPLGTKGQKFCKRSCYGKSRKLPKQWFTCVKCGKRFSPSRRTARDLKSCSRSCSARTTSSCVHLESPEFMLYMKRMAGSGVVRDLFELAAAAGTSRNVIYRRGMARELWELIELADECESVDVLGQDEAARLTGYREILASVRERIREELVRRGRTVTPSELRQDLGIPRRHAYRIDIHALCVEEGVPLGGASAFEDRVYEHLFKLSGGAPVREKTFPDCLSPKGACLRYDFFIPAWKMLVEADGPQHAPDHAFNTPYRTKCDQIKTDYAKRSGYELVRVPWSRAVSFEEVKALVATKVNPQELGQA